jgi:hypothetical protein
MFETGVGEDRTHSGSLNYISVPLYALRELALSLRSRNWTSTNAVIQSCRHTLGGYQQTFRVEVWYSYEFDGKYFAGRVIRDRVLGGVEKVASQYVEGKSIPVLVNPLNPAQSYLRSGLGYAEPFFVGILSLISIGVLLLIVGTFIIMPIIGRLLGV